MELHVVSYGIDSVARPLLLFFSSENRLLWFRYREYDLAHLKLVFEFSIYKVWKSVRYGVSKGEGDGKITTWEELVEKFFCKFYPESYDGKDEIYVDDNILSNNKWKESKYENPSNTATDSFFKAYDARDIEKKSGQGQMKRKDNDKDDKRPHKKICKTEKFKAIKYSLGPNEEYLAIRRRTDNEEKDEKQSQSDKTRLGMEKTVKDKPNQSRKVNQVKKST
ncbi:hypothetical protein Tco_1315822 [Tanacetum coccineum]